MKILKIIVSLLLGVSIPLCDAQSVYDTVIYTEERIIYPNDTVIHSNGYDFEYNIAVICTDYEDTHDTSAIILSSGIDTSELKLTFNIEGLNECEDCYLVMFANCHPISHRTVGYDTVALYVGGYPPDTMVMLVPIDERIFVDGHYDIIVSDIVSDSCLYDLAFFIFNDTIGNTIFMIQESYVKISGITLSREVPVKPIRSRN